MKLELKHLAPYLPYGVKVKIVNKIRNYKEGQIRELKGQLFWDFGRTKMEIIKPILRPLSDLQKEIDLELEGWFIIGGERFRSWEDVDLESLNYEKFTWFVEHHFDVFGLIEKGLAIDINTL